MILWDHRSTCGPSLTETSLSSAYLYLRSKKKRAPYVQTTSICLWPSMNDKVVFSWSSILEFSTRSRASVSYVKIGWVVICTLGFMSSGMAPSVVGLVLTDVWNGTSSLHHQMLFFMDCLNLDTWTHNGHSKLRSQLTHRHGVTSGKTWIRRNAVVRTSHLSCHIYLCQWIPSISRDRYGWNWA